MRNPFKQLTTNRQQPDRNPTDTHCRDCHGYPATRTLNQHPLCDDCYQDTTAW